jgi:preprotein translocase subunit SecF
VSPTDAPPAEAKEAKEAKVERHAGLGNRLYNGETKIDFIGRQRRGFLLSALVIGAGLVAVILQGLNFGIDFRGGKVWEIPADLSVKRVQDVMGEVGLEDAKVQRFTPASGEPTVRVSARVEGKNVDADTTAVRDRLAKLAEVPPPSINTSEVGPSWGKEITNKARNALVVFFLAIAAYLAIRFEWRMAVAALSAVVHDILVTIGVYALTGLEVTPASVIAFLTILGYSLYDTVVVFDRVDENAKALAHTGRATYADVVNLSMNQTLMRSLNTSLVAILPILSVLVIGTFVLGATTLRDFGMALFIGLITGAYSSVFIASPVLALLKEREPRYRQLRARLEQRGGVGLGLLTPAGAARAGLAGSGGGGGGTGKGRALPAKGGTRPAPAKGKRPAAKSTGAKAKVLKPGGSPAEVEPVDAEPVDAEPVDAVATEDEDLVEVTTPAPPPRPSKPRPSASKPGHKGGRPGGPSHNKGRKKGKRR